MCIPLGDLVARIETPINPWQLCVDWLEIAGEIPQNTQMEWRRSQCGTGITATTSHNGKTNQTREERAEKCVHTNIINHFNRHGRHSTAHSMAWLSGCLSSEHGISIQQGRKRRTQWWCLFVCALLEIVPLTVVLSSLAVHNLVGEE